mgnify:CR=1 FL=1
MEIVSVHFDYTDFFQRTRWSLTYCSHSRMPDWSDFVPELACLGVDLVIAAVLCKCYENANKVVRDLNSAAQLNVDSGLKDGIRSHPEAVTDEVTDTVTVPYVALRGVVTPLGGRSVTSLYSQRAVEGDTVDLVCGASRYNLFLTSPSPSPSPKSKPKIQNGNFASGLSLKSYAPITPQLSEGLNGSTRFRYQP